jgi:integral membrane protein
VTDQALDPRVPGALMRYRVMAIITGTFLLLVFGGLLVKTVFDTSDGFKAVTGVIAMTHGWIYIVYLATTIHLWLLMRWGFGRLVLMGLGGIVPFLSFFLEHRFAAEVKAERAGTLEP